jgi:MFS family permease
VYFFIYQVSNGTWSGVGYAYWAESFPTRVRGTAIGWLGAMFSGGLLLGSGVWTALIGNFSALVVWYAVALGFSVIQLALSATLPHIPPGQELEQIAT